MTEFDRQCRERIRILAELQSLSTETDTEKAHSRADDLLLEYLRLIGAGDIADAWEATEKWYA